MDDLVEWMEPWDRVCFEADPDDGPVPTWDEVRAAVPEVRGFHSAEYFDSYMKSRLTSLVRDHLYDNGRYPPPS